MKRIWKHAVPLLLMLAILAVPLSACSGGSTGDATPPDSGDSAAANQPSATYNWNLGCVNADPSVVPDFNSWGHGVQKFVDLVAEYTDGQITITPQWSSVLGGNPAMFEQMEMGELELYYGQPMSGADIRFGAWNIPYLFDTYEQIEAAVNPDSGEIYALADQWMGDHNAKLLSMAVGGIRGFANAKHEVITPEDVLDLKVRAYEDTVVLEFWKGLGTASVLAIPDIYSSLQTGTVDGLEMHPTEIIKSKYYEVTDYYTDIDWQWVNSGVLVIGDQFWNQLTPELQEAVQRAATEAAEYQNQLQKEDTDRAYEVLEENGLQVTLLTPEQKQAWIDYGRSFDATFSDMVGEEVFNQIMDISAKMKAEYPA